MRTFTHHFADRAKVRLSQDGETLRIEVDRGPVDRIITIEVSRPELDNRLQQQKSEVIGYLWRDPRTGDEKYLRPEEVSFVMRSLGEDRIDAAVSIKNIAPQ